MKYGLNDDAVKRIAAVAHKRGIGSNVHGHVSEVYHSLGKPETITDITNAHTLDSMQHKFVDKSAENHFKNYIAKSAAINRGALDPVPSPKG